MTSRRGQYDAPPPKLNGETSQEQLQQSFNDLLSYTETASRGWAWIDVVDMTYTVPALSGSLATVQTITLAEVHPGDLVIGVYHDTGKNYFFDHFIPCTTDGQFTCTIINNNTGAVGSSSEDFKVVILRFKNTVR